MQNIEGLTSYPAYTWSALKFLCLVFARDSSRKQEVIRASVVVKFRQRLRN